MFCIINPDQSFDFAIIVSLDSPNDFASGLEIKMFKMLESCGRK